MTFQESIRACFLKYADFHGKASRSEYWWFVVFLVLAGSAASVIDDRLAALFYIGTVLPLLAAGTRRLRDTGHSGWLQLMVFVPIAGVIILAVYLAQEGTEPAVITEPVAGVQATREA